MEYPRVSIIILNWNGWRDTVECLESLYRITYPNYDVIAVDNGSTDNSVRKIKEYAEGKIQVSSKFFKYNPENKPIKVFEITEEEAKQGKFNRPLYEKYDVDRRMVLIKNKDNYGFAGGNNIGIKFALSVLNPDYILLLNNDTVVDIGFLDKLVKVAEKEKNIGIVGPKILYYHNNRVINSVGAKVNWKFGSAANIGENELDYGQYGLLTEREALLGACMLIKSEVFLKTGLLDEKFFIILEETDFCIRTKKQNYKIMYNPLAIVYHKGEQSRKRISLGNIYYSYRNRILLIQNHFSGTQKIVGLLTNLFLVGFKSVVLSFILKPQVSITLLKAYFDGILYERNKKAMGAKR